jgi:hypothetical protein
VDLLGTDAQNTHASAASSAAAGFLSRTNLSFTCTGTSPDVGQVGADLVSSQAGGSACFRGEIDQAAGMWPPCHKPGNGSRWAYRRMRRSVFCRTQLPCRRPPVDWYAGQPYSSGQSDLQGRSLGRERGQVEPGAGWRSRQGCTTELNVPHRSEPLFDGTAGEHMDARRGLRPGRHSLVTMRCAA